ncbi:MAG: hypothetical protein ACRDUY_04855 [Nitriliruptorales bacterium]
MSGIRFRLATGLPGSHPGWQTLNADLRALDGHGDLHSRRRGVALRPVAEGLDPKLLESLLPGWGRYLAEPGSADTEAVA